MLDINHLCDIITIVKPAMTKLTMKGGNRLMANSVLKKVSVSIKLDDGQDSQGNPKTVSVSLGSLDKNSFDADKALAVVGALEPCLNKSISSIEKTEVSSLSAA